MLPHRHPQRIFRSKSWFFEHNCHPGATKPCAGRASRGSRQKLKTPTPWSLLDQLAFTSPFSIQPQLVLPSVILPARRTFSETAPTCKETRQLASSSEPPSFISTVLVPKVVDHGSRNVWHHPLRLSKCAAPWRNNEENRSDLHHQCLAWTPHRPHHSLKMKLSYRWRLPSFAMLAVLACVQGALKTPTCFEDEKLVYAAWNFGWAPLSPLPLPLASCC